MKHIVSGYLNQRIEIYLNDQISDGFLGTTPNNELYWSTFAKVDQLRSRRIQEANQSPLNQVFQVTVRYRDDKQIYNDMLVKWRRQYYIIQGYTPDVVYQEYVTFDIVAWNNGEIVNEGST